MSDAPASSRRRSVAISLLGNLAVLIGLGFVVVELRQNRQSLDAEIRLSIAAMNQDIASRAVENPDFAELLVAFFSDSTLALPELVRIQNWMWELTSVTLAAWELRNEGIISEAAWRSHAVTLTGFLDQPAFVALFFGTADVHPPAFLAEVRELGGLDPARLDSLLSARSYAPLRLDSVGGR